jgi:hypothetical protein
MRLGGIFEVLQVCWPFIVFGGFTGFFTGLLSTRRGLAVEGAIIKSLLISVIPPLAFFFVVGLYSWEETWPTPTEWSLAAAIKGGIVFMLYLGAGLGFISASSSLLSCIISYFGSKRCRRWPKRDNKKPNKAQMATPRKPSDQFWTCKPAPPLL